MGDLSFHFCQTNNKQRVLKRCGDVHTQQAFLLFKSSETDLMPWDQPAKTALQEGKNQGQKQAQSQCGKKAVDQV